MDPYEIVEVEAEAVRMGFVDEYADEIEQLKDTGSIKAGWASCA